MPANSCARTLKNKWGSFYSSSDICAWPHHLNTCIKWLYTQTNNFICHNLWLCEDISGTSKFKKNHKNFIFLLAKFVQVNLTMTNEKFTDALNNLNSSEYLSMTKKLRNWVSTNWRSNFLEKILYKYQGWLDGIR